ncbi:MAG: ABC transporter permease [bacterium]|nr:ABC transporter permease [bacterium]
MKKIWHIAFLDIKIMVKDKVFFFWTLLFPLVFIFIFGNLYKQDDPSAQQAALAVLNKDTGQWGAYFVDQIKSPGIALQEVNEEPEQYNRLLIIPTDFSKKIAAKEAQQLVFKKRDGANVQAAAQAETRIIQAIAKTITRLILNSGSEFRNIIRLKTQFPENTLTKIPSGFDHVIPGTMVQFIMMMVLIYGGIVVMTDRKRGILSRILFSSASIAQLWGGKFLGRLMMGLLQSLILIVTGLLFFNLNLGNIFLSLLNIFFFCITVASLSILIGSLLNKEDLIVGVSVLTANIFAALAGCWWPIEIVPQSIRTIGKISPAYWAMDAFHQVIFFNKGLRDIYSNFIVLLGYTLVFTLLAVRFFKIKD